MAEIVFNFEQYDGQIAKACMTRLRKAADVIVDAAKANCAIGDAYYTYPTKSGGVKVVPGIRQATGGKYWTERSRGAMRNTIRQTEKHGVDGLEGNNIWIIAGNDKTWWATQMEYGRGGWKGGAKPFMRPALRRTKSQVQNILENG